MSDNSEIKDGEYHPAADSAMRWYKEFMLKDIQQWMMIKEAIASTALSGNRLAEIAMGTINRLEVSAPVSDRYLLGLCWFLRENFDQPQPTPKNNPDGRNQKEN